MVGMDKTQPIRLKHFHENDGGRAKNGTQPKQYGPQCITKSWFFSSQNIGIFCQIVNFPILLNISGSQDQAKNGFFIM